MSFSLWNELPPVQPGGAENIYQVGNRWVITDGPEPTQATVDAFVAGITTSNAKRTQIESAIAADTQIQALKAMTNAEFNTWWDSTVTTPAIAVTVLKRLVRVLLARVF